MARKKTKAKKVSKKARKPVKKNKKVVKKSQGRKTSAKKTKKSPKSAFQIKPEKGEKLAGRVELYFDKISVAALSIKTALKVGDYIHIKGHTTNFYQPVDSMQVEHESVSKVKKGDDVAIKVKDFVREHDLVFTAPLPKEKKTEVAAQKSGLMQTAIFGEDKPVAVPAPAQKEAKGSSYSETKFFNF